MFNETQPNRWRSDPEMSRMSQHLLQFCCHKYELSVDLVLFSKDHVASARRCVESRVEHCESTFYPSPMAGADHYT